MEFRKWAEELSAFQSKPSEKTAVKTIKSDEEAKNLISKIQKKKEFGFLLDYPEEEDSLFAGIAVSLGEKETYYFAGDKIAALKEFFEDPGIVKVTHDIKEAYKILSEKNILIKGKNFDVMLAGYLLSPSQASYTVEALSWTYLKVSYSATDSVAQKAQAIMGLYVLLKKELEGKALL